MTSEGVIAVSGEPVTVESMEEDMITMAAAVRRFRISANSIKRLIDDKLVDSCLDQPIGKRSAARLVNATQLAQFATERRARPGEAVVHDCLEQRIDRLADLVSEGTALHVDLSRQNEQLNAQVADLSELVGRLADTLAALGGGAAVLPTRLAEEVPATGSAPHRSARSALGSAIRQWIRRWF